MNSITRPNVVLTSNLRVTLDIEKSGVNLEGRKTWNHRYPNRLEGLTDICRASQGSSSNDNGNGNKNAISERDYSDLGIQVDT